MKKKQLTPEQFQQLLIATANLPFIRQQRQPTSYLSDVLETVLNFQMQEPVVVKALQYFDHNVQHEHDIHNHEQLQDALNVYPDSEVGNKAAAQFFWGNNHWTRIELLRRFLPFLASVGETDQPSLHAWAKQADFERDFKGKVKGMGIAVFHWLLLRCGVSTIKPDVWVINFGQRVLGKRIPEERLVTAFNEIALLIGENLGTLDVTIWYHEKMNMATADVPALRLVWWQMLAYELTDRLNKQLAERPAGHEVLLGWGVALDNKEQLRHQSAGLTLAPESIVVQCASVQAVQVRLVQSVWYEGMGLTLKVTADQALTVKCFERLCPEMTAKGWQLSNAPVFTASMELEDSLLIPPTTLVSELHQWASEVAAAVVDAMGVWGNHRRNTQRLKGIDGGKLDRHDAGHDGRLEDGESLRSKDGGTGESVADKTDCLGCMTDPIDGHLD
ncbi:MAG: hypothetical protein ACYC03_02865 [Acidovorax defluvii]